MFKMLHPTFLVVPVAWLALLIYQALVIISPRLEAAGIAPQRSWVVTALQVAAFLVFLTPAWRLVWKLVPQLNRWFYPDLNGEWEMEVSSNFSRIELLLDAALPGGRSVDMRCCPSADLPPLREGRLRATIRQSWLRMDIEVWDPAGSGPIRQSQTTVAEPFRARQGQHGLTYIYEQDNDTDEVSDVPRFRGAAWIVRDRADPDRLAGRMWNDRMWRRGMNTAADIRLQRVRPWRSAWRMLGLGGTGAAAT